MGSTGLEIFGYVEEVEAEFRELSEEVGEDENEDEDEDEDEEWSDGGRE
jgi:hypothetical protein